MQTYTHLAIGLTASKVIFSDDITAQLLTIGATLAPDVPTAAWYALDKIQGKQPFVNFDERKDFALAVEISHSLIFWLPICFLLGLLSSLMGLSVMAGVYIHLWMDVISHTNEGPDPDPSWVWPLELILRRLKLIGLFDYRTTLHSGPFTFFTPLDIILSAISIITYTGLIIF